MDRMRNHIIHFRGLAEFEEGHFHESDGKLRLDGAVVLSRKHLQEKCFLSILTDLLHSQH